MAQEELDEAGLRKYREVMGPYKDPTATPVIGIRDMDNQSSVQEHLVRC